MGKDSKYYTYQQASLSQKVSFNDAIFRKLAGADPEISDSIGVLSVLCEKGILNEDDPAIQLMLSLLDVKRKSRFATSDKTNEITKLGFMLPKAEDIISSFDEEE